MTKTYKLLLVILMFLGVTASQAFAAIETHENSKKGSIHVGDTISVKDDKFVNNLYWNTIKNISVNDVVTFRLLDSVYMSYAFSCHITLKVSYYTSPSQTTATDTTINLVVNYSPGKGTTYKSLDTYSFHGAYKILLTVMGITSPEIGSGSLPASFQMGASITINRKYTFSPSANIPLSSTVSGGTPANQLNLTWNHIDGAEEFDVEWTTINSGNARWAAVQSSLADTTLERIFRNNASRITTPENSCTISMLSKDSDILVRIRQVQYDTLGVRIEGDWKYKQASGSYAVWPLNRHEHNLNWQYSAAFAEEGKKKEVISYFDGSLRGRQTVTINNSDNVGVVQENIYDEFGRATASILPAPFKESAGTPYLHYVSGFNTNSLNKPYNFTNATGTLLSASCEMNPDSLSTSSGASKYYSFNNQFKTDHKYNNYIPDAEGFPISVTQFTADNTGRIKLQGGVGKAFQPGKSVQSNTTKYYYGKPDQWELDQLFGNDAGFAEHYLKNTVIDPNGQISLSYLNASGKTIATALTGQAPGMLDTLTSYSSHPQVQNINLLNAGQFVYDASALKLKATTTYTASVIDTAAILKYNMQRLVSTYPGGAFQICSDCYYELTVKVVNDCNDTTVVSYPHLIKIGSDTTAYCSNTPYTDSLLVKFRKVGEYYITFEFAFNKGVIENYVDNFVKKGTANGFLHSQFSFIRPYLDSLDFQGCLGNCSVCVQNLGTQTAFTQMFSTKLRAMGVDSLELVQTPYQTWVNNKWSALKAICDTMQAHCDMGPCSQYQSAMERDVSPGGQYALFDTTGNPLDTGINVISKNWRAAFPIQPSTDTTYYQAELITLPDGTVTSPYDASFTLQMLVQYWKPQWADKFLSYHPEYCKLLFCNSMSVYENWDKQVQAFVNTAGAIPLSPLTSGLHYLPGTADWLLSADPFFKAGQPGYGYVNAMDSDLVYYSTRVLKYTASGATNKSLTQFIDYTLYCADVSGSTNTAASYNNSWNYCTPQDTCRVPDREWLAYRARYFDLKAKYYDKLRSATTCAGVCPVGTAITTTSGPVYNGVYVTVKDTVTESGVESLPCFVGGVTMTKNTTTVSLHYPGGGTPTLDHDVTVNVKYWIRYNGVDGSADPESIVLHAGTNSVSVTYDSQSTFVSTGEFPCTEVEKTFVCITGITGGYLDPGTSLCDGTITGTAPVEPGNSANSSAATVTVTNLGGITKDTLITCNEDKFVAQLATDTIAASIHDSLGIAAYFGHAVVVTLSETVFSSSGIYTDGPIIYIPQGSSTGRYIIKSYNQSYVPQSSECAPDYPAISYDCIQGITGAYLDDGTPLCDGGTVSNPPPPPPYPSSPTCTTYANYQSRFDAVPSNAIGTTPVDTTALKNNALAQIAAQVDTSCTSNADNWMAALKPGLTHTGHLTDTTTLRSALIAICEAGGDTSHLFGASVLPGSLTVGGYHSFGDAIKGITGISVFTGELNPWLIAAPNPYSPKPQWADNFISRTSPGICARLSALHADYTAYISSHTDPGFYAYLQATYRDAMTLSADELASLQKGCANCRFLLAKDIKLPVFLADNATGCVLASEYSTAKTDLQTAFGNVLSTADTNYRTIFANFMNQRWGFALSYDQYQDYEALLLTNSTATLCNKPPFRTIDVDPYACIEAQIGIAAENGERDYDDYITAQKEAFRLSYENTCSLAQASANLTTKTQTYHYTLYYYDQADNLVRTIPPEGVHLLTASQTQWANIYRTIGPVDCSSSYIASGGPTVASVPDTALKKLSAVLASSSAQAIEMWLYNNVNTTNQLIALTPDKHYLLQVYINGNRMGIDIYPLTYSSTTPGSIVFNASSVHYTLDISNQLPLYPWMHLVMQGSNLMTPGSMSIYINGTAATVLNQRALSGGSWKMAAGSSALTFATQNLNTLKHLRFYNRVLTTTEIYANAHDNCFLITATAQPYKTKWYRFNLPAVGGPTTINDTSTIETLINPVYPNHTLRTTYAYNSTKQVVKQQSPDGGINRFWYDLLSRLSISQNDKQKPANNYSYTQYDQLGRISEVGQKYGSGTTLSSIIDTIPDYKDITVINTFLAAGTNSQITHTYYDAKPAATGGIHNLTQNNLRKRVALSTYKENQADTVMHATYYNYDIDGNVKTLYQQIAGLGIKRVDYEYDLVSGKVNFVRYQDGKSDKFYYQYNYDADNRITDAWSGIRAVVDTIGGSTLLPDFKKQDATYQYYLHGPLARVELGDQYGKVQGVDYAYTLQGWLKGVNGTNLNADTEIGQDGRSGTNNNNIPRDAYAYSLGYYAGDYKPIGGSAFTAFGTSYQHQAGDITGQSLYNGNISNSTLAISCFTGGAPVGYTYHYDQLNRLKQMRQHIGLTGVNWNSGSIRQAYAESITYDGNGNILTYNRHGADTVGMPKDMDSLSYAYNRDASGYLTNNRLRHVKDAVSSSNYATDIDDQVNDNYSYDAIGNLIKDTQAGIDSINWNVYGKIKKIAKGSNIITYSYDPAGQRVTKTVGATTSYYMRDAHGNTLALYDAPASGGAATWREQHLYGSSRLGIWTPNIKADTGHAQMVFDTLGRKYYELTNHLSNVLATITDRRVQATDNTGTLVDHYNADIASAQDYYPFGMEQSNRSYNAGNYRYGFNGKENDNEVKGTGNQQDYGMRIYDPRLGRWLSLDPLMTKYPNMSPYNSFENNPVFLKDPDGRDGVVSVSGNTITITSTTYLWGKDATNAVVQREQSALMNAWSKQPNGANWTYTDPQTSQVYNVKFNINVKLYSGEHSEPVMIPGAWSPFNANNYIEINDSKISAANKKNGALAYVSGGYEGLWGATLWPGSHIHEFGHTLGLDDRYHDDPQNPNYAVDDAGWSGNVMASFNGVPGNVDQRNINGILNNVMAQYNAYIKAQKDAIKKAQDHNAIVDEALKAMKKCNCGAWPGIPNKVPVPKLNKDFKTEIKERNPSN